MQYDDFNKQVDRLRNVYGEKPWNNERVRLLWENFKHEEIAQFTRSVDHVIAESFISPVFSKMREAMGGSQYKVFVPNVLDYDCSWCGQTGLVSALKRDTAYKASFICTCELGHNYKQNENYKVWSPIYYKDYELIIWAQGFIPAGEPVKIPHKEFKPTKEMISDINKSIGKFKFTEYSEEIPF